MHGTKDFRAEDTVPDRWGCHRQVSLPIFHACCSNLGPPPSEGPLLLSGLREGGGGCARLPGAGTMVVMPAVHTTAARIHEEVADGAELQAELLGDGDLHFLGWTLVLLEDGDECAALQVSEDQTLFLGRCVAVLVLLLFFALAGLVWMAAVGGMGMRVGGKEGKENTKQGKYTKVVIFFARNKTRVEVTKYIISRHLKSSLYNRRDSRAPSIAILKLI